MHRERASPDYRAYLMRCRRTGSPSNNDTNWRCSLEEPHTGRRRMFASLDELLATLRSELQDDAPTDDVPPRTSNT
jgi:hypothetical protein